MRLVALAWLSPCLETTPVAEFHEAQRIAIAPRHQEMPQALRCGLRVTATFLNRVRRREDGRGDHLIVATEKHTICFYLATPINTVLIGATECGQCHAHTGVDQRDCNCHRHRM